MQRCPADGLSLGNVVNRGAGDARRKAQGRDQAKP